jgi:hypothetical protein
MMMTTTQLAFENRRTLPTADGPGMLYALPDKAPTRATNRISAARARTGQYHRAFRLVLTDWTAADEAVPIRRVKSGWRSPRPSIPPSGGRAVFARRFSKTLLCAFAALALAMGCGKRLVLKTELVPGESVSERDAITSPSGGQRTCGAARPGARSPINAAARRVCAGNGGKPEMTQSRTTPPTLGGKL